MVEEVLDVSRIVAGKIRLNVQAVDVARLAEEAIATVKPAADARGVAVHAALDTDRGSVAGDPERLQQVIWNLLSNAVKFTPRDGRVQVRVARVDSHVEIVVSDSGVGIPADFLPHVFERFRQGNSSTTRAHGGLGLGLAIVHDLVALHGGSVRADSPGEGLGSTFTVRLPAALIRHDAAWTAPPAGRAPRLTGFRVLVVDDDEDTRDVVTTVLEGAGAEVLASTSAPDTRAVFMRAHPHLLIADIGMPGEDGYSLIASIREMETGTSHVPAIALTARTRPEDVQQALAAGFQLHVSKPIDAGRLIDAVATLVHAAV
jgi:CheY-like chemotaxis protein